MAEEYLTDDEQLEAVKRWTSENGAWLFGGFVLGAALLFGYRYYESYKNERALKAAAHFGEMTTALDKNDRNAAQQVAEGLIKEYANTPYADQAELTMARLHVDAGELTKAIAPLMHVMSSSSDTELQHIARLRLARVLIDQGKPDEALATLGLNAPGPFAARYHEIRGDAFFAKKNFNDALTEYKAAKAGGDARSVDSPLLALKIADLGSPSIPIAGTNPVILNKAKP